MEKLTFYAAPGHKILIFLFLLLIAGTAVGLLYFYSTGHAPLLVSLLFFLMAAALLTRVVNLVRSPAISFDGNKLYIPGWFGGITEIDPFSEMEIVRIHGGFLLKQGKFSAVLLPQVLGKENFEELILSIQEKGKTPLTQL